MEPQGPGKWSEWVLPPVVGAGLTLVVFRGLLGADLERTLWADNFDAPLVRWIAGWGWHALGTEHSLAALWNANSFYPHSNTLAYSESLLGFQVFYGPARILGLGPLGALYAAMAALLVTGFACTVRLLRTVGGLGLGERLLIGGVAHFGLCVTAFLQHYQLFGFALGPPFLVAAFLYARKLELRGLLPMLALFVWGVCASIYQAPMLLAFALFAALPFAFPALWRAVKERRWKALLGHAGVAVAFGALLFAVQLRPYFEVLRGAPGQDFAETVQYSASPLSLFLGRSLVSAWYSPPGYSANGDWERAYFPGLLLLLGTAAFLGLLVVARRRLFKGAGPELKAFVFFALAVAVVAWALSLGPGESGGPTPFRVAAKIVRGLKSVRAPGRFGFFLGLPLGVFVVMLVRGLVEQLRVRRVVLALLGMALVIEQWPAFKVFPYSEPDAAAYDALARHLAPGMPVLDFPSSALETYDNVLATTAELNGSLRHWGRLVVGYGARSTPENEEITFRDQTAQQQPATLAKLFQYAQELHIETALLRWRPLKPEVAEELRQAALACPEFTVVERGPDYWIGKLAPAQSRP